MKETAETFGVSLSHVYEMANRGELRVIRLGHRLLVPKDELERILAGAKPELAAAR
jgi:excisionase family DNA binding protein